MFNTGQFGDKDYWVRVDTWISGDDLLEGLLPLLGAALRERLDPERAGKVGDEDGVLDAGLTDP